MRETAAGASWSRLRWKEDGKGAGRLLGLEAKGPAEMGLEEGFDRRWADATAATVGGSGESRGAVEAEALLEVAFSSKVWKVALEY